MWWYREIIYILKQLSIIHHINKKMENYTIVVRDVRKSIWQKSSAIQDRNPQLASNWMKTACFLLEIWN